MKSDIEKLIIDNMGLVGKVAKSYVGKTEYPYEDLYQQGCVGLVKAAKNFDETKGTQFSSYAFAQIQGNIQHMLVQCRPVKTPRKLQQLSFHISKASEKLKKELNREPTKEEIANYMGISKANIEDAINTYKHPLSFQMVVLSNGVEISLGDTIESEIDTEKEAIKSYQLKQLASHILMLSPKLQVTICLHLRGLKQMEIAEIMNVTQTCIARRIDKAIETLKETMEFDIRENEIERVSVNG